MQHFDSTPQQWLLLPQAEYLLLWSADEEEGQTWTAETFPGWTRPVWVHVSGFLSMHPCTTVNISSWIRLSTTSSMCMCACLCTCSVCTTVWPSLWHWPWGLHSHCEPIMCFHHCSAHYAHWLFSDHMTKAALLLSVLRVWDCTDVVFTARHQLCHKLVI